MADAALILRAFKVELQPTVEQRRYLERAAGVARFAYNWTLAEWRRRYRMHRLLTAHPDRAASLLACWASPHAPLAARAAKLRQHLAALARRLAPSAPDEALAKLFKRRCPAKPPTAFGLHAELTRLKKTDYPWMRQVSAYAVREAVADVGKAYEHFFRRLKEGSVGRDAGEPRFRAKSDDCAWHADQGSAIKTRSELARVEGTTRRGGKATRRVRSEWRSAVWLNGDLDWLRAAPGQRLPTAAYDGKSWVGDDGVKLCGVGFSRRSGRWYAAIRAWVPRAPASVTPGKVLGVELGVRELAVTSDGKRFGGVRDEERINRAVRRRKLWERRMARRWAAGKKRNEQSAGWREARAQVSKYHKLVADLRAELLHYVSGRVIDAGAETVVMRDMQVKAMIRKDNKRTRETQRARNAIAPMVAHVGMYELRRKVEYKQAWAGGKFVAAANDYPSSARCHSCGVVRESDPPYPRWNCANCGSVNDREDNAAQNLKDYSPPSGGGADDRGTPGRKTARKRGTMPGGSAKPVASGKPDTDGAHGTAEQSARPLGPGNGTPREASAERGGKRTASAVTQPDTPGEPGACLSDQKVDAVRERRGALARGDHGSQPNPEGRSSPRASRSQSGVESGETDGGSS